jgi:hypothetical protein
LAVHFYKDASPDGLWNLNSCQKESVSIRVYLWLKLFAPVQPERIEKESLQNGGTRGNYKKCRQSSARNHMGNVG